MKLKIILVLIVFSLISCCICMELLSGAATAAGVLIFSTSYALKCKFTECCNDDWISYDERKLTEYFRKHLFGQHLADFVILRTLKGFYRNKNPKKALVMSFHGLTGSGKNYISNMIASSTYKKGTDSAYVHIYSGAKDFPHKAKTIEYQERLQREIIYFTKQCGRSLFIFDEIDKMPPGVLDSLKPFIDYYDAVDGVDFKKNVFIFLSNAGSSSIVGLTLEFWAQGREREEIQIKDIEPLISRGAFNEHGGFQFSELLRSSLVDVFIPFLPLERKHVMQCIQRELERQGRHFNSQMISEIADELVYFPPEEELYSSSGCKRLEQKIDLHIDDFLLH